MVHCGHEPSAVDHTFSGIGGMWNTVRALMFGKYPDPAAQKHLEEEAKNPHGPLVRLGIDVA